MVSKEQSGGHEFSIVHVAFRVLSMVHGFQQIVTQAEGRYKEE